MNWLVIMIQRQPLLMCAIFSLAKGVLMQLLTIMTKALPKMTVLVNMKDVPLKELATMTPKSTFPMRYYVNSPRLDWIVRVIA